MSSLRQLIHEIHRRSLWQVLMIYLGTSWAVMEVTDQIVDRYLLPEWVYPTALILLLIGLPIVLATAFVREDAPLRTAEAPTAAGEPGGPYQQSDAPPPPPVTAGRRPKPIARLLTWPKAILGGALAFTALGIVSAVVVRGGSARVTEAHGEAGDAFEERAWIIVAEFEAPESEAELALAAQTALAVDLQQSQYVNARGRNEIAPVLRRMGLPDTTTLNERLALEVAEREGLSAVLAPAVSRIGADYVFSARVVEPRTGKELIAVRAAAHENRLLEGVETLSREVRRRLGEEREAIRRSLPLPEVTTRSLGALKVYAQAVEANLISDHVRATELAQEAIRLDSTFAMAYRLAGVALRNQVRAGEAVPYATRAYELRDRLTERERLHVEAYYHTLVTLDPRRAAGAYEQILALYPDDSRANNNLGVVNRTYLGNYERAFEVYIRAMELNPHSGGLSHSNAASTAMMLGRWDVADSLLGVAEERGLARNVARLRVGQAFALGELARADALCDSLLAVTPVTEDRRYCGSIDVARGRLERGLGRLRQAADYYADRRQYWDLHLAVTGLVMAEQMRGRPAAAVSHLEEMLARFEGSSIPDSDRRWIRAGLLVLAGVLGRPDLIERVEATYAPHPDESHWLTRYANGMGGSAAALARGEPARAIEVLTDGTAGDYEPEYWAGSVHLLYGLAYAESGVADSAVSRLEGASDAWQRVFSYLSTNFYLPLVLLRLAELEEARGDVDAAIGHYREFLELWSDPDPGVRGQVTSVQRAIARLTGSERN